MILLKNALAITHEAIRSAVRPGDAVADATMGAGRDTAFLAALVGSEGRVYAFDIQPAALERTSALLTEKGLQGRVELILDGHENMDRHIPCALKAVMFNLGYLPGGDHAIGTRKETTIPALNKALSLICVGGLLTAGVYYGGDSGFAEKEAVMDFFASLDSQTYAVLVHTYVNQPNCPPIAVCVEKLR